MPNEDSIDWTPVIGRALAIICLNEAGLTEKPMVDQADFLTRLGIPRKEAALILGTNDNSLRVMQGQRAAAKKTPTKKAAQPKKAVKARG